MTKLIKATLAIQFAVAGVALAQSSTDQRTNTRTGDAVIQSDQKHPAGTVRASNLIGTEVYNRDDKHLGEIKDIVLDQDQKHIGYAVLSYGGLAGMGDRLFAIPHKMIQHSATDNRAVVQLDEQVLKNAPGFDRDKWPTSANADYYRKLDNYYKEHAERRADLAKDRMDESVDQAKDNLDQSAQTAGERLDRAADTTGDHLKDAGKQTSDALSQTGDRVDDMLHDDAQPAAGQVDRTTGELEWNRRVSSVIGANVENANGDNLGEVYDLVLDWDKGQVRYAVLSHGGILGIGDKLFAVPVDAFQPQADDNKLILNIDKEQFKQAPGFDQNQWPDMANPQWKKSVGDFYHKDRQGQRVN